MKEQLLNIVIGAAAQLAYRDVFQISESEKEDLLKPENWTLEGTNSAIIMLSEMRYLFSYNNFFLQVEITTKNNVVTRVDFVKEESKKITYGNVDD